jgi:hypothetical protein
MVHMKVFFLASLGCALANSDGEESSLLQVQRPPTREHSLLDDGVGCAAGKCKPVTKKMTMATTTTTIATTTTTTTTPPAVNPTASCDGVSCEKICSGTVLRFEGHNVVENSLAGSGRSGGGRMKIIDVAEGIDLYVSDTQREMPFDASSAEPRAGYAPGEWMSSNTGIYTKDGQEKAALRIAMESTGIYEFKFELKNKAGEAAVLDEFPLVFYDMDYYEAVEGCGVSGTVISQDTDLRTSSLSDGCVKFSAGYKSAESPDDFDHPTPEQARASAAFIYEKTSEWTMKFQLKYYSHRWVLFKSSKALACE